VIRVCDDAGNVIEGHKHAGDFKESRSFHSHRIALLTKNGGSEVKPMTFQILRLLRFASLMLLFGSVAPASAQTVKERMKKDPGFRIYPVIFGVTATTNSTPPVVRVVEVGTPPNERTKNGDAPKIDIPNAWIEAAEKKIQAEPPPPKMKDGKPAEVFAYFFYVPEQPNIVVTDLNKPLDKQP
jgi:hypothetical protein